jgi:glycosyltransferase involved in cell wall biosynthesis
MKIAIITLGYSPYRRSGLDVSGERLVKALLAEDHQVWVITGGNQSIQETHFHPNLKIVRVSFGPTHWLGFCLRASRKLEQLCGQYDLDVVHFLDVYFAYSYRGPYVASLQHSFRQRLASMDFRTSNLASYIFRYLYYVLTRFIIETPSIKRAKGLLAGSETSQNEFIRYYNIDRDRVVLARHGIDTVYFQKIQHTDLFRNRLGIPIDEPIILFVGFITPRKGLEYLIKAFAYIKPTPWLLIIGKWNCPKYRESVIGIAGSLSKNIIELDSVSDEDLPTYYSMADVYTSSSLMEGFGIPLAEAMSCQTPVVATNSGSTAEVVGPGGFLVEPRDVESLAQRITYLLNNPSLRTELGQQGRKHVEDNFSIHTYLQSTTKAYHQFL